MIAQRFEHEAEIPAGNEDLEQVCLGLMLWKHESIPLCAAHLTGPEDFSKPAHALLYSCLTDLHRKGVEIDVRTIAAMAPSEPEVIRAVSACCDRAMQGIGPPPVHAAKLVADLARRRRAFDRFEQAKRAISDGEETVEVLDRVRRDLESLNTSTAEVDDAPVAELMADFVGDCIEGNNQQGIETGFIDVDRDLGGMLPGESIIVAGRTSMGKSAFCLNVAMNAAKAGHGVVYMSVEMPTKMLMARIASSLSGVPVRDFTRRQPLPEQAKMLMPVPSMIDGWNLHLVDIAGWTIAQVEAHATKIVRKHGTGLVILDYVQKIESGRRYSSRQDEVSHVSGAVHEMAMRLNVPVIAAAQINRMTESHSDKRPQLHHLRESGSLEQDADTVILLHREDYYHRRESDYTETNIAEVDLAKNRNGEQSTAQLLWHGPTMTFRNYSPAPPPKAPPRQMALDPSIPI